MCTGLRVQPAQLSHPRALPYTWCPLVVNSCAVRFVCLAVWRWPHRRSTALADVLGTWLQTLAAARAALRTTWFVAMYCFRQPLPGRRLRPLLFYAASGTRQAAAPTGSSLHPRTRQHAAPPLQTLAGRTIGELDDEGYELRRSRRATGARGCRVSQHHTQPLRECPRRPAPASQA